MVAAFLAEPGGGTAAVPLSPSTGASQSPSRSARDKRAKDVMKADRQVSWRAEDGRRKGAVMAFVHSELPGLVPVAMAVDAGLPDAWGCVPVESAGNMVHPSHVTGLHDQRTQQQHQQLSLQLQLHQQRTRMMMHMHQVAQAQVHVNPALEASAAPWGLRHTSYYPVTALDHNLFQFVTHPTQHSYILAPVSVIPTRPAPTKPASYSAAGSYPLHAPTAPHTHHARSTAAPPSPPSPSAAPHQEQPAVNRTTARPRTPAPSFTPRSRSLSPPRARFSHTFGRVDFVMTRTLELDARQTIHMLNTRCVRRVQGVERQSGGCVHGGLDADEVNVVDVPVVEESRNGAEEEKSVVGEDVVVSKTALEVARGRSHGQSKPRHEERKERRRKGEARTSTSTSPPASEAACPSPVPTATATRTARVRGPGRAVSRSESPSTSDSRPRSASRDSSRERGRGSKGGSRGEKVWREKERDKDLRGQGGPSAAQVHQGGGKERRNNHHHRRPPTDQSDHVASNLRSLSRSSSTGSCGSKNESKKPPVHVHRHEKLSNAAPRSEDPLGALVVNEDSGEVSTSESAGRQTGRGRGMNGRGKGKGSRGGGRGGREGRVAPSSGWVGPFNEVPNNPSGQPKRPTQPKTKWIAAKKSENPSNQTA